MSSVIVQSDHPVTLLGAGQSAPQDLEDALKLAPLLVAADGGASVALAAGHLPAAVIGDFDSLKPSDRARLPADRLHHIAEQESTDFDKALRHISAPLVLAVGFLGARIDHQLAAFNTLTEQGDRPCLLIGAGEIVLHLPARLSLDLSAGDVVSLFPLMPVQGRSTGLQWPIEGLDFRPGGRIGTSNRATGPVQLDMDGPGMLLIVPRRALVSVTQAVLALR